MINLPPLSTVSEFREHKMYEPGPSVRETSVQTARPRRRVNKAELILWHVLPFSRETPIHSCYIVIQNVRFWETVRSIRYAAVLIEIDIAQNT